MSDLTRLIGSTQSHEDFRSRPYLDTQNLWTFGIGRCLETNPLTPAEWKLLLDRAWLNITISKQGADWLAQRGLAAIETELAGRVAEVWPFLGDARQNVLIEMAFQMGVIGCLGFHDMWTAIRAGDWKTAADEMLDSKWFKKQTPERCAQLSEQMRSGEFPS
jgi:lysozyme